MTKPDKPELNIDELSGESSQSGTSKPNFAKPKIDLRGNKLTDKAAASRVAGSGQKQTVQDELAAFKKKQRWRNVRFAIIAFVVFALIFNYQVIYSQFLYLFSKKPAQTVSTAPAQPNAQTASQTAQPQTVSAENVIIIPKINVNAPIVFPDSLKEDVVLASLQNGVAHYAGTANPGENGNAVFFGHSSNDWWEPGSYKFVFVLLEKLVPGDTFEIHYNSHRYDYVVTGTKTVMPTDISVLTQTPDPTATLITCTPPGTSWKRFIVNAKQVDPAPASAQTQTASSPNAASQTAAITSPNKVLPSAAPSLIAQISNFFTSLWNRATGHKDQQAAQTQPAPAQTQQHLPDVQ